MAPSTNSVVLNVSLVGDTSDPNQSDKVTRKLLGELREQEIESASLVSAKTPPHGTKGATEAVTVGAITVTVLTVALPKLIDFIQAWALRGGGRQIKVRAQSGDQSLEVEFPAPHASREEVLSLIEEISNRLDRNSDSRSKKI